MKAFEFKEKGIMLDCSRDGVINFNAYKKMVDILSELGYNVIRLYMEDTYEVKNEPYFGLYRGKYSINELKAMDKYAAEKGIELMPSIQTLAHLNTIFRYGVYNDIHDADDILLAENERTYKLIDNMFASLSKAFTSRRVNIGMDEAFMVGRGKYADVNGNKSSYEIMGKHLNRVLEIAEKYGFCCEMWADMFMRAAYGDIYETKKDDSDEVKKHIPENVKLVYWDYYHLKQSEYESLIQKHLKLSDNISFVGGAWTWTGFCPNNTFSIAATKSAVKACVNKGINEFTLTLWGDNGGECSYFGVLPTLVAASCFFKGIFDENEIKRLFKKVVGIDYDLFYSLEYPDRVYSETDKPDHFNPSKVFLYSDLFCGPFDKVVKKDVTSKFYAETSKILKKGVNNKAWGHLFAYEKALSDILEIKAELGIRTRELYLKKDKEGLKKLADNEYKELAVRLEKFFAVYDKYWNAEKKPFGFEIHTARIGGVILRTKNCRERLYAYISGETDCIPELDEPVLTPFGVKDFQGIMHSDYKTTFTFGAY